MLSPNLVQDPLHSQGQKGFRGPRGKEAAAPAADATATDATATPGTSPSFAPTHLSDTLVGKEELEKKMKTEAKMLSSDKHVNSKYIFSPFTCPYPFPSAAKCWFSFILKSN